MAARRIILYIDKGSNANDGQRGDRREHFRLLYQRTRDDQRINQEAGSAVFKAACEKFGESEVRHDSYIQKGEGLNFPVLARDGRILSSLSQSETLERVPVVIIDYVYISPKYRKQAVMWLDKNRKEIITPKEVDEE